MKLGFSGHRNVRVDDRWLKWIHKRFPVFGIWVHGGAHGFDNQVEVFARQNKIKTEIFLPEYDKYPAKTAPLTRNRQIVSDVNMMIFAWDGRQYGGTYYTLRYATEIGTPFINLPIVKKKTERQEKREQMTLEFKGSTKVESEKETLKRWNEGRNEK